MQHFYFKYMIANEGIERLIKFYDKRSITELKGKTFPLSIYFGKWKVEERQLGFNTNKQQSSKQIETFYNLATSEVDNYLWIFFRDKILQTKVVGKEVYDGFSRFIDKNGSYPKSLDVLLTDIHNKIELPESFSNINSNQSYNRKTISELKETEEKIANAICKQEPINIDIDNLLDFLSPTEFETLLFLIFSNENVICSSYRGGTLKDYDLRIKVSSDFHGIPCGLHWIQVKFKKDYTPKGDVLTVCLTDKTDFSNNIIGIDWLKERIKENKTILTWLQDMTFGYPEIYNIKIQECLFINEKNPKNPGT